MRPERHTLVRLGCATLALAVLLGARRVEASAAGIPDGDSATLIALLLESLKQTTSAGQILTAVEGSLATAQHTLAVARTATEVVNEFRYLTENPDEIFDAAQAAFEKTFPEVEGVRREADALRSALAQGPNGELNPYALQETLDELGRTQASFYDTLIALDEGIYGLSDAHLQLLSRQDALATQGEAVFRETMDPGCLLTTAADGSTQTVCGLDLKRAAVLGAKSQAISAASLRVITEVTTEQLRLAKLQAIRKLDDGARMSAQRLDHARGLASVAATVDEALDPTVAQEDAPTFVERPTGGAAPRPGGAL
ncbi:MAG: hypothetical protein IT383_27410 [Deltaproteobacteria bacterium]|nr:hypothetical protein [Deltaproteobacteria bacterium]